MPIYAYKCASCGHADDVLQKMSDDALTHCPACGAQTYSKQVTAPAFALKGSGWYVTDFRGGNKPADAEAGTAADKPALTCPSYCLMRSSRWCTSLSRSPITVLA